MIDLQTRQELEWELQQIAFKFQKVPVEDALEVMHYVWDFAPELQEHVLRGNIPKAG